MSFETLSERYEFIVQNFPQEWLPLTYLYDPDLPLFPLLYFHELDPNIPVGQRPGARDRVFGFVHHINLDGNTLLVCLATNKDLNAPVNSHLRPVAERAARERLGLGSPVTFADIDNVFTAKLAGANAILTELWYQVVDGSFGKSLPFGRMWDPVFGLARFVASYRSEGGRKGEFIQTHDFVSSFGEKIATGGGFHADFYLLPTWAELRDTVNPLNHFPKYRDLLSAAQAFVHTYCETVSLGAGRFSAFRIKRSALNGKAYNAPLNTAAIHDLMTRLGVHKAPLFENYTAFNRGPPRSIISLLMLNDLRMNEWDPSELTQEHCANLYKGLQLSWQSSKVIELYAQQCFGSETCLPIDNWVEAFLKWPLKFEASSGKTWHKELFEACPKWGRVERLVWLASQARKVHASVCSEVLWCVRYGFRETKNDRTVNTLRGANPLACKLCAANIRNVCPSYRAILSRRVVFNQNPTGTDFALRTDQGNNTAVNQAIVSCEGNDVRDVYSTADRPSSFQRYPAGGHDGSPMTVAQFMNTY